MSQTYHLCNFVTKKDGVKKEKKKGGKSKERGRKKKGREEEGRQTRLDDWVGTKGGTKGGENGISGKGKGGTSRSPAEDLGGEKSPATLD